MSRARTENSDADRQVVQTGAQATMRLCGETVVPDINGALYWPRRKVLILSDLHFEKGSFHAARGIHLPPYDTAATLALIARVCARYQPDRVIALGDSFHDHDARDRMTVGDAAALRDLVNAHDWVWITGNHDPAPPRDLGGAVTDELDLGPFVFRHVPRPAPATGEISGHLHPVAVVRRRGRRLRRRCFASDGTRVVVPAFGAYTGGLDVTHEAFDGLFDSGFRAWMIGAERVFPVSEKRLLRENRS